MKKVKLYQPVVDCVASDTLFLCPIKARNKLIEMIQEIPYWGEQHYFDRWAEDLAPGDSYGFGSGDDFGDRKLEAYITILELEE